MKRNKKTGIVIWSIAFAAIVAAVTAGNCVAVYWGDALEGAFGSTGMGEWHSFYQSEYASDEELVAAQRDFVERTAEEGAVLLRNENRALPLKSGAKVSLFGHGSVDWVSGGKGSGAVATDDSLTVKKSLESAGFSVNETLWKFTQTAAGKAEHKRGQGTGAGAGNDKGDWRIGEIPQSEYTQEVKDSYASFRDAAIVVIGRIGGEGSDLPRNMNLPDNEAGPKGEYNADSHYLQLDNYERALLSAVKEGGFEKIVVIVNAANPMELGFLEEYGVDACFWLAGTGNNGINAIGKLLSGEANPSGRLVDTYAYSAFSAPAMQNLGDYRYVNERGELQNYSYMVYAEGVYVGYRYYETRYADRMTGGNAGDYDYAATVQYPFGYGLSYTDFAWSDYTVSEADAQGKITAKVTITNTGEAAGKEVVELYAQSPYTDYDRQNHLEKPAVALVGFEKTKELKPGESQTVELSVNLQDLASYDAYGKKTYLLEQSDDYYLTVASDAHSAINHILTKRGAEILVPVTGERGAGNAELAKRFSVRTETLYDTAVTGQKITNLFDFADLTKEECCAYDGNFKYLSRNNWQAMDGDALRYATGKQSNVSNAYVSDDVDKSVYTRKASDNLLEKLGIESWENSGNPQKSYSSVATGKEGSLTLNDMIGKAYDDPAWNDLVDRLTAKEMHLLFRKAGYCTQAIESIGKPKEFDYDGPAGIANYLSGKSTFGYASEIVLASTWNKELAYLQGKLIGEDGIKSNTTGWYAPAMNLHRTPFSGRNYEYYSEDSFLSGVFGLHTVLGAQERGMYCDMKHFAGNDQETNRMAIGCVAIWSNEQALRELYFKPFQMTVEKGNCHGVMTTMNRIGDLQNFGNYPLITQLLRGEWGFEGVVITDYITPGDYDASVDMKGLSDQILAAGGDLIMNTGGLPLTEYESDRAKTELRRAAKNVLFVVSNSNAMGETSGGGVRTGVPVYVYLLIAIDAVTVLGVGCGIFLVVRKYRRENGKTE